jgi:hypothetical protein
MLYVADVTSRFLIHSVSYAFGAADVCLRSHVCQPSNVTVLGLSSPSPQLMLAGHAERRILVTSHITRQSHLLHPHVKLSGLNAKK